MYSLIRNPIDDQLTIIRDDKTGFYNISKTLKEYCKTFNSVKIKSTRHWLTNKRTIAMIELVKLKYKLEEVQYGHKKGAPVKCAGTYVHPVLHTQFMIWLDSSYEVNVSMNLYDLHSIQGDVIIEPLGDTEVVVCQICQSENAHPMYDGHCCRCFQNTFPDAIQQSNFKTKEKSFMDPLKEIYPDMALDRVINGGCSKRRPDGFLDLYTHVIIVEIDEGQHRSYRKECENKRLMEIYKDVGYRNIVVIRLNPDEYINDGVKVESAFGITKQGVLVKHISEYEKRLQLLKDTLVEAVANVPDRMVTTIYLCFSD